MLQGRNRHSRPPAQASTRVAGIAAIPRAWLPLGDLSNLRRNKGIGLVGGAAMALLAGLYGIAKRQRDLVSDGPAGGRICFHAMATADSADQIGMTFNLSSVPGRCSNSLAS